MSFKILKPSDIFRCKQCGDCCKGYGGTFVTVKDVEAISKYIKTDSKQFLARYCQMSGQKPVLAQGKEGYCVFWDGQCTIHQVKPRMCRLWPFIESVLLDIKNWQIMAGLCPGIRSDVPDSVVRTCVEQELSKESEL